MSTTTTSAWGDGTLPVSVERLAICRDSAEFWTQRLGTFGEELETKADVYAIVALGLSTLTAGAVWTTVSSSTDVWAQVAVTIIALLAALAVGVPKTRNFSGGAVKASELSTRYGSVYGDLLDAVKALEAHQSIANDDLRRLVEKFESIKAEKDNMHPKPRRLQQERDELKRARGR